MFATSITVDLAERIIDDICLIVLFLFQLQQASLTNGRTGPEAPTSFTSG